MRERMMLNPDDLRVTSFQPGGEEAPHERCCTGCDSGCGLIPTLGGCVSSEETQHEFC